MKSLFTLVVLLIVGGFASAQTPSCASCSNGVCSSRSAPGVGLLGVTANTFQRTTQFVQGTVATASSKASCKTQGLFSRIRGNTQGSCGVRTGLFGRRCR